MQVILVIVEAPAVMVVGVTLPLLEQDGWQVTGGMDETDVHEIIGVLHGDQAGVTLILMRLIITTTTEGKVDIIIVDNTIISIQAHLQIDQNQAPPRRTRRHPELEQLLVLVELREDKLALYKLLSSQVITQNMYLSFCHKKGYEYFHDKPYVIHTH